MTSKPMNIRNKSNVAIITRTKNRPLFLIRCIKTVLAQQYQDWIHVIVNDGGDCCSVDEIVRKNHEAYRNRIKVIHNQQSLGMEAASNIGVKNSESNYITILDDDDQVRLLKQLLQAENIDEKRWPARQLAALIDGWKNRGLTPDRVPAGEADS
mgnify:CR=1 FL=1